jgi:hypothetical protein
MTIVKQGAPFLIGAVDPMKARGGSLRSVRASVMPQLLSALAELGIRIDKAAAKERKRRCPIWKIISALLMAGSTPAASTLCEYRGKNSESGSTIRWRPRKERFGAEGRINRQNN